MFLMVCSGVLYMRFHQPGSGSSAALILAALGGLVLTAIGEPGSAEGLRWLWSWVSRLPSACVQTSVPATLRRPAPGGPPASCAGFSVAFTFAVSWSIVLLFLLLFAATTASLLALPVRLIPERFQVGSAWSVEPVMAGPARLPCSSAICLAPAWQAAPLQAALSGAHQAPSSCLLWGGVAAASSRLELPIPCLHGPTGPAVPNHASMRHRVHNPADCLPGERRCGRECKSGCLPGTSAPP